MQVLYYLIPYIVLLLLLYFNTSINTKTSNFTMALCLICFSAFRYDVGYDYLNYYDAVQVAQVFNMEFFQTIIIETSYKLQFTQLFFIVNSFITVSCIYWGLKRKSPNLSISLFAFLCVPLMFLHSMSIVRFWTALSVVFVASTYLQDKKYLHFIILNTIAIGFHNAAVFGYIFLPLFFIRIGKWANLLLLVMSVIISSVLQSYLSSITSVSNMFAQSFLSYANADESVDGFSRLPYVFLLFDLYLILGTDRIQKQKPEVQNYIFIYNIGCCIMFLLSFQPTLSSRLSRFFLIYLLLIIPYILECKTKFHPRDKKLVLFVGGAFFYFFMLSIFNYSLKRYEYLPYQLFF